MGGAEVSKYVWELSYILAELDLTEFKSHELESPASRPLVCLLLMYLLLGLQGLCLILFVFIKIFMLF